MTSSTKSPEHFGASCWDRDRPDNLISSVARVDAAHADSFLACHSPITSIVRGKDSMSESEVFEQLFRSRAYERLVVVTGEPGSGKSHLINWLKLRLDDALAHGEKTKIKSVMIKRRAGSLRDALEQMVEQLPDFHGYLDPIKAAISKLTSEFARRELCFKLSQLLHQSPLSERRLRELFNFFSDPGALKWLCRDGGVVDRNIQRLISQSEIDEREALPLFEDEDLLINNSQFRREAGQSVQDLLDVIEADDRHRKMAIDHANSMLRAALEMLTGLGNQTLHQIFRSIRQDLKKQDWSLALFIEDVSTLSALDTEVINVLEPQNDPSLCRLYGVVGMTDQALDRLPDNMRGRIDLTVTIKGGDEDGPFKRDMEYVDRFVARYLNALRLSEADIGRIAQYRRDGSDVRLSACEECKFRVECFNAFGKVDIEDQEIGLFPFRPGAAHRLLDGLDANRGAIKRNPRGLLQLVVTPLVGAVSRGLENAPVNMGLAVDPRRPTDLDSAQGRYLGGWNEKQRQRLNYFVWYWTGNETFEKAAAVIEQLRVPLGFPELSQKPLAPPAPPPGGKENKLPLPPPNTTPPQPAAPTAEYLSFIALLERWSGNNEPLRQDVSFRDGVWPILKTAIPWDDMRQPTDPARKRLSLERNSAVEIEGQVTKPKVGALRFNLFPRSEDTAALLRVGLRFRLVGRNSWAYPEFVADRRLLGRWLRRNINEVSRAVDPTGVDPNDAHAAAIRCLILAYQFSQRKSLPGDYSDAINELFSFDATVPATLSQELSRVAQDLPERVTGVRAFLCAELNVPQGTGGVNLIDPLPIVRTIGSYKDQYVVDPVDERFNESFWATRFKEVVALGRSSWVRLGDALEKELIQIGLVCQHIANELAYWEFDAETVPDRIEEFVEGCKNIKRALTDTRQPVGEPLVDAILSRQDNPVAAWKRVLREAEKITESESRLEMLRFSTEVLIDLRDSLAILVRWAKQCESIINEKYKVGTGGGDLDQEIVKAGTALDLFQGLKEMAKGGPDVKA